MSSTTTPPSTIPILHRSLGIGQVMLAAVFVVLTYAGVAPLLPRDEVTPLVPYTLAGIGMVLTAVTLILLKPRVPERRAGQTVEQYWTSPDVRAKVLAVWFLLEAAATISLVAYLLTGEIAAASTAAVAMIAFWFCGPKSFAKE